MFALIITLIIICAILLVVVVLAQNPKGGGLTNEFGGSASSQLMGVKRTGDLMEKLTWGLVVAIFVLSVASKMTLTSGTEEGAELDNSVEITNVPAPQQQAQPTPQQQPTEETKETLEGLAGETED